MSTPTDTAREFAIDQADRIGGDIARSEQICKELLDQRVYTNGVRGATVQIRTKLEEVEALLLKLRKAIHDDFGSPEEK